MCLYSSFCSTLADVIALEAGDLFVCLLSEGFYFIVSLEIARRDEKGIFNCKLKQQFINEVKESENVA